ncbi:Putative ribonuclease H protein At1g65750 [Linum perenne]
MKAESQALSEIVKRKRETLLKWIPAPDEWLTVNCDGSVIQSHGLAAAGGIIRDNSGHRLAVFSSNLGSCTIIRAELRAAAIGLELAWGMHARKVNIQIDSNAAVLAICGQQQDDSRHSHILQQIRDLLNREWVTSVSHIFREGNSVADILAHHGHTLPFGVHSDLHLPPEFHYAIRSDCSGVSFPRMTVPH